MNLYRCIRKYFVIYQVMTALKSTAPGNRTVTTVVSVTPTMTHLGAPTARKAGWALLAMTSACTELRTRRIQCVFVSRRVGTVRDVILSVQGMVCVTGMEVVIVHISLDTQAHTVKFQVCVYM